MKRFIFCSLFLSLLPSLAHSQNVPDIMGYTDKPSYHVGDTIRFYLSSFVVSVNGDPYNAAVTAMGYSSTTVATVHIDSLRVQAYHKINGHN